MRLGLGAAVAVLWATACHAQQFDAPDAKAALARELYDVFLEHPEILHKALYPPEVTADEIYADEIAADLNRIGAESQTLFASQGPRLGAAGAQVLVALFVDEACPDCDRAKAELTELLGKHTAAARVFDLSSEPAAQALMDRLTLDTVPSYVMPDRMIRGHMPQFVLERYLSELPR